MRNKSGSIVIVVLLVLSLIATLTMQLMRRVTVHTHFDVVMLNREKAKMLALGGLNLAASQLTFPAQVAKREGEDERTLIRREFLRRVLPVLGTWQTFVLTKKVDGLDGKLKVCLMSEDGKININEAFDFTKGAFKKEYDILGALEVGAKRGATGGRGVFAKNLAAFLKKRGRKLDDISELLALDDAKRLPLFYEPPVPLKKGEEPPEKTVVISDLFTTHTRRRSVEPWLLSNALCLLFGLREREAGDDTRRKDSFKRAADGYKKNIGHDWQQNFSVLEHIYEKQPRALSRLLPLFAKEFDPAVFTVLSSGSVQGIEVRLLAVLHKEVIKPKKESSSSGTTAQGGAKQPAQPIITFRVAKIYWL